MDAPQSKLGKKRRRKQKEEKKRGGGGGLCKENVEHSCIVVTTMTLLRSADPAGRSTKKYTVRFEVPGKGFH